MIGIAPALRARSKTAVLVASMGALIAISAPMSAAAAPYGAYSAAGLRSEVASQAGELRQFYAARQNAPVWISPDGAISPAVQLLLHRIDTAQFDALDRNTLKRLRTKSVRRDLDRAARGSPEAIAEADVALSRLFAAYVRAMRSAPHAAMIYESPALAPAIPTAASALEAAARAPSLDEYVKQIGWMHPFYAPLRDALEVRGIAPDRRQTIWENLERVRALPATPADRYVLVDAASARLWMYENGAPVDSMKVVVGKPESQTPAMAGFIRYAIVNPYWNVPPDLVQKTIARGVLAGGSRYLKDRGYEVLSSYGDDAAIIDPAKVDWQAVADGGTPPYVRQKPGGSNFMGKVKYEFPNPQGIYLHDTPDRHLLALDERQLSNGCVRLEDAERLGRWLMGTSITQASKTKKGAKPERKLDLPTLVPVYITYLTAVPTGQGIAFTSDVYGRDSARQLALAGSSLSASGSPR